MSIKKLSKEYSGNKIRLKYYLTHSKYTRKQVQIAVFACLGFVLSLLYFVLKMITPKNDTIFTIVLLGFVILLIGKMMNFFLLKYELVGKLYLDEEKLILDYKDRESQQIPYENILKIEYYGCVRESVISSENKYKTYQIKLILSNHQIILFEAAKEMILTTKDQNIQRMIDPPLIEAINAISPKFGVVNV